MGFKRWLVNLVSIYALVAAFSTTRKIVSWIVNLQDTPSSAAYKASYQWTGSKRARPGDAPSLFSPFKSTDRLFISKAFNGAMSPSRIVPFYYRALSDFEDDDITITTLVTGNRFDIFSRLVESYQGPISATVHITSNPSERDILLDTLHELYASNPYMSKYVDMHLVLDPFERQFNLWRNIARFYARTDYVMMLDVDFSLCTDFRSRIRGSTVIMDRMRQGRMALVVPAFEFTRQQDGLNVSTFPRSKNELLRLVKEDKIDMFHRSWKPGHESTDYQRYYAASPGEVYRVVKYTHAYEPYVIFKREQTPWCDMRFIGYGGNKAACLFELYLSGVSMYVLPDDFIIHQSHTYAEQLRKHERKYNSKVYAAFREEICLKYITQYTLDGTLESPQGHNVQEACRLIPGVPRLASQLISGANDWKFDV